jgi:hypothetical protein
MELDLRDFDLGDLTEDVSGMFAMRCEQKGLTWRADVQIGERAVRADDRKLRQILINLLGNAVKFTDRGVIGLKVEQSGQRYTFSVEGTGPGITEESRKRIFEPFQQAEEGEAKGGTGLGLAITKRHIELMGGSLSLESTPGEGSCFRFELDLPPAEGIVCVAITASGLLRQRSFYRDAIQLPGSIRERLLTAARINALTEIETLIAELKGLNPDTKCLAVELEKLLSRYDMDAITALINRFPAVGG